MIAWYYKNSSCNSSIQCSFHLGQRKKDAEYIRHVLSHAMIVITQRRKPIAYMICLLQCKLVSFCTTIILHTTTFLLAMASGHYFSVEK